MKVINNCEQLVHFETQLPFPYQNREGFFHGQAYDLLFEKNAFLVHCRSYHDNKLLIESHAVPIQKNDPKNVIFDLDYMTSK